MIWFFQNSHPLVEFSIVESASTGPWGSLLLLLNPKLIQGPAAAGAFLTLALLAVGPSTQQLISIPNQQIDIGVAKVPQSTGYDAVTFGRIQAVKTADLPLKVQSGALTEEVVFTSPNSTSGPQTPNRDDNVVLSQDGQRYTVGAATAAAISTYISDQLTGSANGGTGEQVLTSDTMQAMYTAMTTNTSNIPLLLENAPTSMLNTM